MDYEIKMPILSDTMEKGKLIKWHVKEGDKVKKGDVIAEVESDKAIMEVQTFKDGIIKKLLAKEGEEIAVKNPIAIIETEKITKTKEKKEEKEEEKKKEEKEEKEEIPPILEEISKEITSIPKGIASPLAKKMAQKEGIDIEKLQKESILPSPAHAKDIQQETLKRYFTPKAIKLLDEYQIDYKSFKLDHKIDSNEIKKFIKQNNIPKIVEPSSNQKAVIKNVVNSQKKPVFYMFETFEIEKEPKYKLTSIILKRLGIVMQNHPMTRAVLEEEKYKIYPNSNISLAVYKDNKLFMVVCKNVEQKSIEEIDKWVRDLKKRDFTIEDFKGSTFGLSNLGMFEIKSFTAMINQNDSGILAVGALDKKSINMTFTFDHRVINGVQAALFIKDLKNSFKKG